MRPQFSRTPFPLNVVLGLQLSVIAVLSVGTAPARAQGVATGTIDGRAVSVDGRGVDGALVLIVHAGTGVSVSATTRHGRFLVPGLEPGGPYEVVVTHPLFHPARRDSVFLTVGEPARLAFVLHEAATVLDTLYVASTFSSANAHGGTATFIADSLLHRLPTLDRNLYDFVRLVPQVSTRIGFSGGGMSAGGVGFRYNSFLVDGVSTRTVPGGVPLEFAGLRSVPLDAVREYRVLVAPFDVRYGDFAGALVNAVTRSGTNRFEASAFIHARTDELARADTAALPYERLQYGVVVSGPVWRDRVHFLIAPELQHFAFPAAGPYIGQSGGAPVPVTPADIARLDTIMHAWGLRAGHGGAVENRNPLRNVLVRVDAAFPSLRTRAVLAFTDAYATSRSFARSTRGDAFALTSSEATQRSAARGTSARLITTLERTGGGSNELLLSYREANTDWRPAVQQPSMRVAVLSTSGGISELLSGTPPVAHGSALAFSTASLRDDLSLPLGPSHVAALGFELERFRGRRTGLPNAWGTWRFSSLDSLAAGSAESFQIAVRLDGTAPVISGGRYALYAGDEWRSGAVTITGGVRAEWMSLADAAPYSAAVDSIFGRRTDLPFRPGLHLSPRLGITWAVQGGIRLRGGIGVFTGSPPMAWLHSPLYSYGGGVALLRCGTLPGDVGPAPPFVPDYRTPPEECADGQRATVGTAAVNLTAERLRLPRTLRGVIAVDRRLPLQLNATAEAVLTRNISDYVFANLNLAGPQGFDRNGRVLYGRFGPTGVPAPTLRSGFSEVVELRNNSRNHSVQLTLSVDRTFAEGRSLNAHYTYSRVRDTQTPLRVYNDWVVNWASRAVAGSHENLRAGVSLNDVPHRFVLAGTHRVRWLRWITDVSFYYVGESGSPFTYVAYGAGRRGDLNADGSNGNDPAYIPRSAFDTTEIRFSGISPDPRADNSAAAQVQRIAIQQSAFEQFVERTACLRRQRGIILARNSCREPWTHTTAVSVRQLIPALGRTLAAQVDIHNPLNLLNRDWGIRRIAVPGLLEHVDQTSGETTQPVFRFTGSGLPWEIQRVESAFQVQLGLRYRF